MNAALPVVDVQREQSAPEPQPFESAVVTGRTNPLARDAITRVRQVSHRYCMSALLMPLFVAAMAAQSPASSDARAPRQRPYANPIDIDYRYNFEQLNQGISYRSGADPVIVVQRGKYYLFETLGGGYWESSDLGTWRHVTPTRWPINDIVAPSALSVRDTIYLLPSTTSPLPILMLPQAGTGRVEYYNRLMPWLPMARDREGLTLARPDSVQPGP